MTSDNVGYNDALDGGVEERLRELGRSSDLFTSRHNIVSETIQSWHCTLNEKELAICEWIFYTMSDLNSGNSAMYEEVVLRLSPFNRVISVGEERIVREPSPFRTEVEIHETIAGLVSRGILEDESEIWKFGSREENIRVLRFVHHDLYKELISSSNENFIRVTDAYFLPRKKTSRGPE